MYAYLFMKYVKFLFAFLLFAVVFSSFCIPRDKSIDKLMNSFSNENITISCNRTSDVDFDCYADAAFNVHCEDGMCKININNKEANIGPELTFQTLLSTYLNDLSCSKQGNDYYCVSKNNHFSVNCNSLFCTVREYKTYHTKSIPYCDSNSLTGSAEVYTDGENIGTVGIRVKGTTITLTDHIAGDHFTVNGYTFDIKNKVIEKQYPFGKIRAHIDKIIDKDKGVEYHYSNVRFSGTYNNLKVDASFHGLPTYLYMEDSSVDLSDYGVEKYFYQYYVDSQFLDNAKISFILENPSEDIDSYRIIRIHKGEREILVPEVSKEAGHYLLTVETDGFSIYALTTIAYIDESENKKDNKSICFGSILFALLPLPLFLWKHKQ